MLHNSINNHTNIVQFAQTNMHWKERLDSLISHPRQKEAGSFIQKVAAPALHQLADQFITRGFRIELDEDKEQVSITLHQEDAPDFSYGIRLVEFAMPSYAEEEQEQYFRAEIFLMQGGQDYDVLGYTQEQIIADAITQYLSLIHI